MAWPAAEFECRLTQPALLEGPAGGSTVLEPGTVLSGWIWLGLVHEPTTPDGPALRQLHVEAHFLHDAEAWVIHGVVPTPWLRPNAADALLAGRVGEGRSMAMGIHDTFAGLDPWPEALVPRSRVPSHITGFSYDVEIQNDSVAVDLCVAYSYLHYRRPVEDLLFNGPRLQRGHPVGAVVERTLVTADAGLIRSALRNWPSWRQNAEIVRLVALVPIQLGRPDLVDLALEQGLNPAYRFPGGATLLHLAVTWKREAIVDRLLVAGVNANAFDESGDTPLHRAIKTGQTAIAAALVSAGAREDLAHHQTGLTAGRLREVGALHAAVASGDLAKVRELLALPGASSLVEDEIDGRTALLIAAEVGDAEVVDAVARATRNLDRLRSSGAPWNALQCAAAYRRVGAVEALLHRGADPNLPMPSWTAAGVTSPAGRRPLHLAAQVACRRIALLLLDRGAEVNARDAAGETALSMAAWHRYGHKLVALLLERGAERDVRSPDGLTPLERARRMGHTRVVAALES